MDTAAGRTLTFISVLGRYSDEHRVRYARLGGLAGAAGAVLLLCVAPAEPSGWAVLGIGAAISTLADAVFVAVTHLPARRPKR